MLNLKLEFYQRVYLWNTIGNHNAPSLKEASVFLRIIEKVRLSDQEQRDTGFGIVEGRYGWNPPSPDYGLKAVELEDEEAKALATALEASPLRVNDALWLDPLVKELQREQRPNGSVPPRPA